MKFNCDKKSPLLRKYTVPVAGEIWSWVRSVFNLQVKCVPPVFNLGKLTLTEARSLLNTKLTLSTAVTLTQS